MYVCIHSFIHSASQLLLNEDKYLDTWLALNKKWGRAGKDDRYFCFYVA